MSEDDAHIIINEDLNKIRALVIDIERVLRVLHQQRHPMPKPELDLTPTQPLDPEVRQAIDETS